MKKNLLVTLTDKNYIEQAKQLFSSVYFNAGWKGDYMLLAHEIPEKQLKWFRDKGILIKKCKPIYTKNKLKKLYEEDINPKYNIDYLSIAINKFYLFTPEFKKWKNIVYLDADIIVRACLDDLIEIKRFAAVSDDLINNKLIDQFIAPFQMGKKTFDELKKKYNLSSKAFNTGVMAFSTNIIKKDTFSKLRKLFKEYNKIQFTFEQNTFNLFFYNKWEKLPLVYNLDVRDFKFVNHKKIRAVALHFVGGNKPWFPNNTFYNEWKFNLDRIDRIDFNKTQATNKKRKKSEIRSYSRYLKIRFVFYFPTLIHFIDRTFGLIGIILYNRLPSLYSKLKKIKKMRDR